MVDLFGPAAAELPSYGLMEGTVAGLPVVVSQTGFTGEKGYEIYLRDATLHAEDMWNAVLEAGKPHQLKVIAPAHHRRVAAGILSWGQDMDAETLPFQVNLAYQVPRKKEADYIGKAALEKARDQIDAGQPPFRMKMVGLRVGGKPIDEYAPDFWLIRAAADGEPVGYLTSPWWSPELETNIALGWVPVDLSAVDTKLAVSLPDRFSDTPGVPVDAKVVEVPFRPSINPNQRELLKERGLDAAV
jgi:aminomethyltransferase